jgi:hypothetical protein
MGSRWHNSMALLKTSWGVLKQDKELAVIPVVSALLSAAVMGLMGLGLWATVKQVPVTTRTPTDTTTFDHTTYQPTATTYLVMVAGYVLLSIVVTYCTAALVAGAHERLTGGTPGLGRAFAKASSRLPQLLGWAVINATVGLVLRSLAERGGIFGQIAASLLNFAWTVVSWLAIPFIVINGAGPIDALKESGVVLNKTWGENLVANVGFGLVNFAVMLVALAIGAVFVVAGLPLVGIVLALVLIAVAATIMAALSGIYRTALFLYAANGYVPAGFDPQLLANAFRTKRLRMV